VFFVRDHMLSTDDKARRKSSVHYRTNGGGW
jgi:hypothetical protein